MAPILSLDGVQKNFGALKVSDNVSFELADGEALGIIGPNGAGKSTLFNLFGGTLPVSGGTVRFLGQDLLALEPEERAHLGIFMAFQYPVELPGVNNTYFLQTSLNAIRTARGEEPLNSLNFMKQVRSKLRELNMDESLLRRSVNTGFSGGEMKRNEILQMSLLEPKLAILDETDSGLDIDALRIVADGVNALRSPERSMLVITHYQRLLDYIQPDYVHVLSNGRIIRSGDKSLALELEEKGYGWIKAQEAAA